MATSKPAPAKQMIERVAAKGYWSSPSGKTSHATLYAATLWDIQRKGDDLARDLCLACLWEFHEAKSLMVGGVF
jgi:hypothetical protein